MHVFRLCSEDYKALDGEGARLYGGRWNSVGLPLVYTSQHLSLCLLEQLVHLSPSLFPSNWVAIKIEIPDSIKGEEIFALPRNEVDAKTIGDDWIRSNQSLFLKVPSSIIHSEYNVLINPSHPDLKKVRVMETSPFIIDARLI